MDWIFLPACYSSISGHGLCRKFDRTCYNFRVPHLHELDYFLHIKWKCSGSHEEEEGEEHGEDQIWGALQERQEQVTKGNPIVGEWFLGDETFKLQRFANMKSSWFSDLKCPRINISSLELEPFSEMHFSRWFFQKLKFWALDPQLSLYGLVCWNEKGPSIWALIILGPKLQEPTCFRVVVWGLKMTKGTSSFGKRRNKTHTICRRCGTVCSHFPSSNLRLSN